MKSSRTKQPLADLAADYSSMSKPGEAAEKLPS